MNMVDTNISAAGNLPHKDMANSIRALAMDAVQQANSGHPGMPMGMADVASVLYGEFLNIDPKNPNWPDRDRFVLSAGHGSMLQYALHHLVGFDDMDIGQIKNFRQMGARTAGHPEYGHAEGIETTTGPLGQGITTAVGMALAERMMAARFGSALVDHFTYVIAGDGCLQEGISHEAIDLAGHLRLKKLIVMWDDNSISIDGSTDLSTSMNQAARFKAAGWDVQAIDGHNPDEVRAAIAKAQKSSKPSMIACKTTIGFGAPTKAGTAGAHGAPLGKDEIAGARKALGWSHGPFEIPKDVYGAWKCVGERGDALRSAWDSRLDSSRRASAFKAAMNGDVSKKVSTALRKFRREQTKIQQDLGTRNSSQMALEVINAANNLTVGGSADLTGSNLTRTAGMDPVSRGKFKGRYVHYGIREHAMGAVMNGMALHGGMIPYGGTFMVFTDYAKGAMRLSALMGQRVIYVMTHVSIGLGEDGPTHQPIEHLATLRATPNTNVFRPADIIETAECWEIALETRNTPSVLCLSRQKVPTLRTKAETQNLSSKGAYVLSEPKGGRDVTIMSTGTEVAIAVAAAAKLASSHGIKAAVVSMPCWELFEAQDNEYQSSVLGTAPRIGLEAAARFGWDRWLGNDGEFIGMNSFGASAPYDELYEHFGITAEAVVETAIRLNK